MKRYEFIKCHVNLFDWKQGAEVGLWKGDTFFYLLDHCPKLKMIGIDQWEIYNGFGDKGSTGYIDYSKKTESIEAVKKQVLKRVKKYGDRAKIFPVSSLEASEHIEDESLDFIFIDGDHRLSFVRSDLAVWTPKVKRNGIIIGHDWNIPSVRKGISSVVNPTLVNFTNSDHVWSMVKF